MAGKRRYRFWLWLLAFVRGKCNEAYVAQGAVNLKCPACHTWTAETDGPLRACEMADYTLVTCRQCGVSNTWCLDAPVPYRPGPPVRAVAVSWQRPRAEAQRREP